MPFINNVLPQKIFNIIFRSGYYGVILFFVISGFLITSTTLRRWGNLRNISLWEFYQMRFARIMPCLIVFLCVLSALHLMGVNEYVIHQTTLGKAIFSVLTFQYNWLEAKVGYLPANWTVLWSLSVEEMFYLFFPLVCLTIRKPSWFTLFMLVFIVLGPFARVAWTDNDLWSDHSYLSCMDGIAFGCLAAIAVYRIRLSKKMFTVILTTGLLLFILIFFFRHETALLGLTKTGLNVTVLEIGVALILIAMHAWYGAGKHIGSIFTAPLRWFGKNSYEIYLTHEFFILIVAGILFDAAQSPWLIACWYMMAIVISGLFGQFIASTFSEPMNRLIRVKKEGIREMDEVVSINKL